MEVLRAFSVAFLLGGTFRRPFFPGGLVVVDFLLLCIQPCSAAVEATACGGPRGAEKRSNLHL